MSISRLLLSVGFVLCVGCTKTSGAMGPQGYEQSLAKYRVNFADTASKQFLSDDWRLDNYSYNPSSRKWQEKDGKQYRAQRRLDEDGDGTITSNETREENIYDLRFVNVHDNAVIWLKVHPMEPTQANLDLDVLLEGYADGLEGTGLFEQSTLFGVLVDKARHFTTFMVKQEPTTIGKLPAIRGVLEVADVDKLRLDSKHRDSKAELVFAKVLYLQQVGANKPSNPRWPIVVETSPGGFSRYMAQRTGLLVIGYYADASRFDSHLADLHGLLKQVEIPEGAIPPNSEPPARPAPSATPAPASSAAAAPSTSAPTPAPAPAPAPSASDGAPATPEAPAPSPVKTATPKSKALPEATTPVPGAKN